MDMRLSVLGITATAVMVTTAAAASSLIWLVATDPLALATTVASGDGWTLLALVAARVFGLFW